MSKPRIDLIGRLGQDPSEIVNGKGVKFSIAVDVRKEGGPDWYNIVVWHSYLKDFVKKWLKKGSLVVIGGLQTLQKTETTGHYVNIEATNIQFGPSNTVNKTEKEQVDQEEIGQEKEAEDIKF